MILGTLLILFAWFIEMPLWLSIVTTVIGSLKIVINFYEIGEKAQKEKGKNKE